MISIHQFLVDLGDVTQAQFVNEAAQARQVWRRAHGWTSPYISRFGGRSSNSSTSGACVSRISASGGGVSRCRCSSRFAMYSQE